jgi:hypothetical protein
MADAEWYYNYFKQFVDDKLSAGRPVVTVQPPAEQNPSHPVLERPKIEAEEEIVNLPASGTVEKAENISEEISTSPDVGVSTTSVVESGKVLFGKAPPALLAAIKRPGRATRPASLDLSAAGTRKRSAGKADGQQPPTKAKKKPRLTEIYPGLAKFK